MSDLDLLYASDIDIDDVESFQATLDRLDRERATRPPRPRAPPTPAQQEMAHWDAILAQMDTLEQEAAAGAKAGTRASPKGKQSPVSSASSVASRQPVSLLDA